ncbi:MAG: phenylacetaldoxime dehydratase family protein [Gammaproteobacteria bacterium]|nr:phenylacetaldoxime dehydratase family protein [Gammaproteobacteria bacterium]
MESAIPTQLRCPRTRPARASEDYVPPYPAFVARIKDSATQVAMAYFGVQYRAPGGKQAALDCIATWKTLLGGSDAPGHQDLAHYVDDAGFDNLLLIAYWDDVTAYRRWDARPDTSAWWNHPDRLKGDIGCYREVLLPRLANFETLISTPDSRHGVALVAEKVSEPIQEHGYWGGMRDRLPSSQTDALRAEGKLSLDAKPAPGARVRVAPHENLTLIRSGQDWTQTQGNERDIYLGEVEPVLREGMGFLNANGPSIGCYVNRYMRHVDDKLQPTELSFGMSYWRSLEQLERWAESHPTHVAIFGGFMSMVQKMNFDLKLRLYHEVTVAKTDEQFFEYLNCHPATGLLRGA